LIFATQGTFAFGDNECTDVIGEMKSCRFHLVDKGLKAIAAQKKNARANKF
jgi:hypothetical protein